MQRLARYPLEKAKTIMKMMYKASWANHTGRWRRGWTLHSMKRGTKTTRRPTMTGSHTLSLPGWGGTRDINYRDRLYSFVNVLHHVFKENKKQTLREAEWDFVTGW